MKGSQGKQVCSIVGRAEQPIAARRLDSFVLKMRASSPLGCCSLGAAESGRYVANLERIMLRNLNHRLCFLLLLIAIVTSASCISWDWSFDEVARH